MNPMIMVALGLGMVTTAAARVWTDVSGRKIEAEIISVDGDKVVLQFKGKSVPLALAKLSPEDQKFVTTWQDERAAGVVTTPSNPAAAVDVTLCGKPVKPGGAVTIVEEPLSPAALKSFPKSGDKPSLLKIAVALPAGFDPAKPQHVMWVSAPHQQRW